MRFVEPRDAEELQDYFRSLTIALPLQPLPRRHERAAAERCSSEFIHVGEADRFSVVATMMVDGFETIVGEARYAFDADTASFEFGLSIDDRWQGQGIGKALLKNLECRAAAFGAERLFGDTLRSNDAMIALARKSGYAFTNSPGDWKLVRFEKQIDVAPQEIPCASWRLAAHASRIRPRMSSDRGLTDWPGSATTEPGPFLRPQSRAYIPPEHRLALVDEGLHRLAVIGGHGGADQALGLVVAGGGEIEQQGFVEIVLHVAQRNASALRPWIWRAQRPPSCSLSSGTTRLTRPIASHRAASTLSAVNISSRARDGADQPRQQPGDAIVAGQRHPQIAGGDERRLRRDADVAGHGDGEAGADRGAGQRRDGRLAHRDQRAGQQALAFLQIGDLLVIGHFQLLLVAMRAHALDVAAGAERLAGAGDQQRADLADSRRRS